MVNVAKKKIIQFIKTQFNSQNLITKYNQIEIEIIIIIRNFIGTVIPDH